MKNRFKMCRCPKVYYVYGIRPSVALIKIIPIYQMYIYNLLTLSFLFERIFVYILFSLMSLSRLFHTYVWARMEVP